MGTGSGPALVRIEAGERQDDQPVRAFLRVGAAEWVESVCPTGDGDGYVWTRKRVVPVECDVRIGERRIRLEANGIEDESCGYHPRHTVWDWSAGVGKLSDGRAAAWNLVSGINDPPERSERAIWIDGTASEPAPVHFEGLDAIELEGGRLEFSARCERRKEEQRRSSATPTASRSAASPAPCPAGSSSAEAFGVIEHHDAHW